MHSLFLLLLLLLLLKIQFILQTYTITK